MTSMENNIKKLADDVVPEILQFITLAPNHIVEFKQKFVACVLENESLDFSDIKNEPIDEQNDTLADWIDDTCGEINNIIIEQAYSVLFPTRSYFVTEDNATMFSGSLIPSMILQFVKTNYFIN